jgi:hypothetical protein
MEGIFAIVTELLATLGAVYSIHATMTCRLATGIAIAKMVPFGKAVTCIAANPINLGHLAVTALLFGTRHPHLPTLCTMESAKIPNDIKLFRKLLNLHESRNGISIQKLEHAVAHEILRKHLGKEHRWRRIILPLGLVAATLLSLSILYHGGGGVALRDQIKREVLGLLEKQGRKPERTQPELLLDGRLVLYATVTRRSDPRFGLELCVVAACVGIYRYLVSYRSERGRSYLCRESREKVKGPKRERTRQ